MNSQSTQRYRFKGFPLILIITFSLIMAGGLFWMSRTSTASANFPDYQLAEATYPNLVSTRIDSCSLCHTSAPNLNSYGTAYKALGRGASSSLTGIENVDSDQDGVTNIQEIMALTFPGDSTDFPVVKTATISSYPPPPTTTATATATVASYPPPATATATRPPATATSVGPTATKIPATATKTGPTATKAPATATSVGPTATKLPATATKVGPTATKPGKPTATRLAATATKVTKVTRTPGARPTPVVQCVKNNKDDAKDKSSQDSAESRRANPCPPGYHPRGGDWEGRKGDDDFFKQILQKLNTLLQSKKKP